MAGKSALLLLLLLAPFPSTAKPTLKELTTLPKSYVEAERVAAMFRTPRLLGKDPFSCGNFRGGLQKSLNLFSHDYRGRLRQKLGVGIKRKGPIVTIRFTFLPEGKSERGRDDVCYVTMPYRFLRGLYHYEKRWLDRQF